MKPVEKRVKCYFLPTAACSVRFPIDGVAGPGRWCLVDPVNRWNGGPHFGHGHEGVLVDLALVSRSLDSDDAPHRKLVGVCVEFTTKLIQAGVDV
jgi:hypothetical protein